MEVIQYSLDVWQFKTKDEFVCIMNNELANVKESFFKLGMYLSEAYVRRYNNGTGIDDFFEWVYLLFGMQKSMVYNLMRIYNVFRDKKGRMLESLTKNIRALVSHSLLSFSLLPSDLKRLPLYRHKIA